MLHSNAQQAGGGRLVGLRVAHANTPKHLCRSVYSRLQPTANNWVAQELGSWVRALYKGLVRPVTPKDPKSGLRFFEG